MKTSEIRSKFLAYFAEKSHQVVPSSSLIPHGDPTLLFTNAGMVQFKNLFLGVEQRDYVRAVSSQKCVRAGGKHNDLENVGHTARHHTFFEMLGNFSFGDYFKREAIEDAWLFLTQTLALDPSRLFVTVFEEDQEAADIWLNEIGIPHDRLAYIGAKDNFWSMGDTGPCGPCSEIFFDHGANIFGGPPGSPDEDGDRFIEIWNLVFMQYNRDVDGNLTPLPKPSVDTGMGLERIAAVMQGVHNNYDIDLFLALIDAAAKETGIALGQSVASDASLRVIADHLRSVSFLLADGVLPSNEGRGFVLRRILRRACRHGRLLGMEEAFIYKLVSSLVAVMGDHFAELVAAEENIRQVIRIEEERFIKTLDKGLKLVEQAKSDAGDGGTIPGEVLFTLYDTFGFPTDLTADILRGSGIHLDMEGFEQCMDAQRTRARAAWGGSGEEALPQSIFDIRDQSGSTEFLGYTTLEAEGVVVGLLHNGEACTVLSEGQKGWVIVNQTPFYAESGGQIGDQGIIHFDKASLFVVHDTKKILPDLFVHIGVVQSGEVTQGRVGKLEVDPLYRQHVRNNHTATHLLHAMLREVVGDHVKQAGSMVSDKRLRFDFNHFSPLGTEERLTIERRVNALIGQNDVVVTQVMQQDDAIAAGAMALFGEKYGDEVRVVSAGVSTELCGGTHAMRTGDIGLFRIVSETGIAAGVRRIEAVTGLMAYDAFSQDSIEVSDLAGLLKVRTHEVVESVKQLQERVKQQELALLSLRAKSSMGVLDDLIAQAVSVAGVPLLVHELTIDVPDLRDFMDKAKQKMKSGVIVFAVRGEEKVQLVVGVTDDLLPSFHAGNLIKVIAGWVDGKGGGKADMAMAGGTSPAALSMALERVAGLIKDLVG
ncbi:MAG: alanine--tRNA ligase [Zetaproteobacteria bacterium]|nr:alanine--tRNA ligase [Zetaproteobacteria bacterium]